jgi:hypothetical protein
MAQRFKSKNPGAVIPLLAYDLVITGGTPISIEGDGFRCSRARIERSGYAERADYWYLSSGMTFDHVEAHLAVEAIHSLELALAELAVHAQRFSLPTDPNESFRMLRFWTDGQAVELFAPLLRQAVPLDPEPLSSFAYAWQMIDALIPPSPKQPS